MHLLFTFTFYFYCYSAYAWDINESKCRQIKKKTALFALFAFSLPRLYINTTIRKLLFFASHFYGRLSSSASGSITPSAAHSTYAASI